jgi:hypothetical protein
MPMRISGRVLRNEAGTVVWKPDGPTTGKCIWAEHGVWGWDETKGQAVALRENYFKKHPKTGQKVLLPCFIPVQELFTEASLKIDWYTDYWYPFVSQWSRRVQAIARKGRSSM